MKYIDSGSRDSSHSLASWLEETLTDELIEIRFQTGFFSLDGIGLFIPSLEKCRDNDFVTNILIGSNDSATLKDDVIGLIDLLGVPRNNAQLGIVNFDGAFFHPKTYHIKRADGSQAAYVGSANLTPSGLSLHIEAGIALDTRDGDAPQHLSNIAVAIDSWFNEKREGMALVDRLETLDGLIDEGVISIARPPRPTAVVGNVNGTARSPRPRLQRLYKLPSVPRLTAMAQAAATTTTPTLAVPQINIHLASVARNGFPPYLSFEPNPTGPTHDVAALTGVSLRGGSAGLIIQLNRDSARHFMGRIGTANISIPVATVSTIRFGVGGKHSRPTGMFNLHLRYIADAIQVDGGTSRTSLMGYGYTPTETGHGDIRMLVPAAVRSLAENIQNAGKTPPTSGDLAFLEWPTLQDPAFRLTFIDTQSSIYLHSETIFNNAVASGQTVGNGACWLTSGLSPAW